MIYNYYACMHACCVQCMLVTWWIRDKTTYISPQYNSNICINVCILYSSKFCHSKILCNRIICAFGGEIFDEFTYNHQFEIHLRTYIFSTTKIVLNGMLQYTMWWGFSKKVFIKQLFSKKFSCIIKSTYSNKK